MPPFRLLELPAILRFPFLAVLIGDRAVFVPERTGSRFDRFFSHRLKIHAISLRHRFRCRTVARSATVRRGFGYGRQEAAAVGGAEGGLEGIPYARVRTTMTSRRSDPRSASPSTATECGC